jgi:hypothetical protein
MDEPNACDSCPEPGHCCRDFPLWLSRERFPTALDVMVLMASNGYDNPDQTRVFIGMPFVPIRFDETVDSWRFNCVNLQPDGRCGDYANRPFGPCVLFRPGSDPLCVLPPSPPPSLPDHEVGLKKPPVHEAERETTWPSTSGAPSCALKA